MKKLALKNELIDRLHVHSTRIENSERNEHRKAPHWTATNFFHSITKENLTSLDDERLCG
jgi:hypothetical protein